MVGLMDSAFVEVANIEANCAICGAPPNPECPHEGQRLELALEQAMQRWEGLQRIRYGLDTADQALFSLLTEETQDFCARSCPECGHGDVPPVEVYAAAGPS